MSISKFIRTLSESKHTFALEQKASFVSFVKNVAFLFSLQKTVRKSVTDSDYAYVTQRFWF